MSKTAFERANPPPRRKSCAACTKAKRRCDLSYPSCVRCVGRGISCHYPQRSRAVPNTPPSAAFQAMGPSPSPSPMPSFALPKGLDFSIDALMDEFCCAVDPLRIPGPAFSFGPASLVSPATIAEMSGGGGSSRSADPSDNLSPFDVNNMMCSDAADKQLISLNAGVTGDDPCNALASFPLVLAERLTYVFEFLPTTRGALVETLGTPWCHPMVFRENPPQAFQDILAYSALYGSMSHTNKPVVMAIILSRMRGLAATAPPSHPYDALAHTLALGMYHIIALLDGDIECRAAAEVTLPALGTAAASLLPHISPDAESSYPADLPLYPLDETSAFWRNWVLAESLRRTMLFAHQFAACYALVRAPAEQHDCRDAANLPSWTLSAHLWDAGNAVDFAVAWGSKNRWLVSMARTNSVFEAAAAEDICQFGRMLMTSFMGHQQARGWFAMRGGKF